MNAIGKARTLLDKVLTPNQILDKINNVRAEEVYEVIQKIFQKAVFVLHWLDAKIKQTQYGT